MGGFADHQWHAPRQHDLRLFNNWLAQLCFRRRKPGRRLVEQEKSRIDGERPRQPDPAFFPIAQAGGRPMRLVGGVQFAENLLRYAACDSCAAATQGRRLIGIIVTPCMNHNRMAFDI
jgi:hypothetical protein